MNWLWQPLPAAQGDAAATDPLFGWFQPYSRLTITVGAPSRDAFVRPIRDGVQFTTPTPSDLGWFEPYWRPTGVALGPNNSVVWTPFVAAPPSLGWFEPYSRLPTVSKAPPISSFALAPVNIATPPFGWFELYAKSLTPSRAPVSVTTPAMQFTVAATVTPSDMGWFVPYAARGASPPPGASSTSMDPQAITPVQTLTTDIGWFAPYFVPPKQAAVLPVNAIAQTAINITAPPIGWLQAYARLQPIVRPPVSAIAMAPQPFVVVTLTTSIGWFEPYAIRPPSAPAPRSSIVIPRQPFAVVVQPVVPTFGGGIRQPLRATFAYTREVHWGPIELYARPAFDFLFVTPPRPPEKPVQAVPPAPAPQPVMIEIAIPEPPETPPEPIFAGWQPAAAAATVDFSRVMVDMKPVVAAKRRRMAGYVEAAQAHDRQIIEKWLAARGVKL